LLQQGIYIAPSQFETGFVSAAHSEKDIAQTIAALDKAFATVRGHMHKKA
jgi:glutamate-1-semialdehyde 2,1-aminomutase